VCTLCTPNSRCQANTRGLAFTIPTTLKGEQHTSPPRLKHSVQWRPGLPPFDRLLALWVLGSDSKERPCTTRQTGSGRQTSTPQLRPTCPSSHGHSAP
jgi:hypothetical protein